MEVSPLVPAIEDHFLNLLEISNSGTTGKHRVELLKGQNVAGAAFESGPIALFNTTDSSLVEGEVSLPALACKKLYLTGLIENVRYEVTFAGPNITTPASVAGPGIAVKTEHLRANDKGVAMLDVDGAHTVRLRLQQV